MLCRGAGTEDGDSGSLHAERSRRIAELTARRDWVSPIGRTSGGGVDQRLVTRITLATPKVAIPDNMTTNGNTIVHLQTDS